MDDKSLRRFMDVVLGHRHWAMTARR